MLRGLGEVGRACSLEGFRQFPIVDGDDKSVDFFFFVSRSEHIFILVF